MKKIQTTVGFVAQAESPTFHNLSADPGTNIQASVIFDLRLVTDIANSDVVGSMNNMVFEV